MCLSEKNHKVISMFVFVTIKSWHRREGRNLFITGTSKNSTVKGDQPNKTLIRDSELQDTERARVRQCVFFLAHNREEEVQGDRGLDQQMHKHTHKQRKHEKDNQTKYFADTLPGLWWTDHKDNRGRRLTWTCAHTTTNALLCFISPFKSFDCCVMKE